MRIVYLLNPWIFLNTTPASILYLPPTKSDNRIVLAWSLGYRYDALGFHLVEAQVIEMISLTKD